MVIHKSFSDFVLFLYVHMAFADGDMHSSEESVILDKISKIFPVEGNPKKKFDDAVAEYKSTGSHKVMDIIKDSFKHFTQVKFAQKYKVYTDMYDIINADGKVEESETDMLKVLKDIIDMNAEVKA